MKRGLWMINGVTGEVDSGPGLTRHLSRKPTYRPLRSSLPGISSVKRVIEELRRSGVCQHSGEKFHLYLFRAGAEEFLALLV